MNNLNIFVQKIALKRNLFLQNDARNLMKTTIPYVRYIPIQVFFFFTLIYFSFTFSLHLVFYFNKFVGEIILNKSPIKIREKLKIY